MGADDSEAPGSDHAETTSKSISDEWLTKKERSTALPSRHSRDVRADNSEALGAASAGPVHGEVDANQKEGRRRVEQVHLEEEVDQNSSS